MSKAKKTDLKRRKKSAPLTDLLVVAHPDDETIFFGALLLSRKKRPWRVVCVTDGNADGQGEKRRRDFKKACGLLGAAQTDWLGFPDIYEKRLDIELLREKLKALPKSRDVFTHGILGEYGHPHHQDVSFAVHETFSPKHAVYSVAHNCYPEFTVKLSRDLYEVKTRILSTIYHSETSRFANLLPATAIEGFTRVELAEVRALYRYMTEGLRPPRARLKAYRWFDRYLDHAFDLTAKRLF